MHSIRTKTTLLTVLAIVLTMVITTAIGAESLRELGGGSSEQILRLMCETGEKNLDAYFDSVEQSVEGVSAYIVSDLKKTPTEDLESHLERAKAVFEKMATNTHGTLTYYYRIDPRVSETAKGFWFVNLDGEGFKEHEVTDITRYDTKDTSKLVWFTVPKATGKAIWLPPYVTDNLDMYVLSYNVPVYKNGRFIGVVGIELDYETMTEQVDNITLYDNGYAFVNDDHGKIVYHPKLDIWELTSGNQPVVPEGLLNGDDGLVRYVYNGVEKQAVCIKLHNGMRLNVTVPVSEINGDWMKLIRQNVIVSAALLLVFVLLTARFAGQITKPLKDLTEAAEKVNNGSYDFEPQYSGTDEVGRLTSAFCRLTSHLKEYISDLNDLAYADALTSVRNKGAFSIYMRELQEKVRCGDVSPDFAVGIFDCDNLKEINDLYGHDKGDIYLKTASRLICQVFDHSPVFRIGGDEFAVILMDGDFKNRDELTREFDRRSEEITNSTLNRWEQVSVSYGIALYDPTDESAEDVIRQADKLMYNNKRDKKLARK